MKLHTAEEIDLARHRVAASPRRRVSYQQARLAVRAFTLIEVLVVVAIIALLISVLVPALLSAREQTRLVLCQSNQRNLVFAWHAYLRDHRDRLPRDNVLISTKFGGKQGKSDPYKGPRILNRYLSIPPVVDKDKGAEVFWCPGDKPRAIDVPPHEPIESSYFDLYGTSYRTNRFVVGPIPPESSWYDPCQALMNTLRSRFNELSINVSSFSGESKLILLGDYGFSDWQNPDNNSDPVEFHARSYRRSDQIPYDPFYASRHNVSFLDGHVAFTPIRKGIHVCADYTVIPFRDMQSAFAADQRQGDFR